MKKIFSDIYDGIVGSLDNEQRGFSAKKLTAITITACIVAAHIKWMALGDFTQLTTVLTIDFGFVSLLFGINVADKKVNPPS